MKLPGIATLTNTLIYRQLGLPVFQNRSYPTRETARSAKLADIELVQNHESGLVFNRTFDSALVEYDGEYENEQAHSASFRRHLREVLEILLEAGVLDRPGIEIGCGKGYFLSMLLSAGADFWGFDPAYVGNNPRVKGQRFEGECLDWQPKFVVLRHVLEHLSAPWDFLEAVKKQCHRDCKIYVEVPCFDWIVEHKAFYDIFYEHANYFTLDVLRAAFPQHQHTGKLFGGQYLFLVADLSSFKRPSNYVGRRFPQLAIDAHLEHLLALRSVDREKVFIWGAGAKGITFSSILFKRRVAVQALIDINPAKQGTYAPYSGVPILGPEEAGDQLGDADVFVMNPAYMNEIVTMSRARGANWIPAA